MGWWVAGIGAAMLFASGLLTRYFIWKHGIPLKFVDGVPGTGIVPVWVSAMNLASWPIMAIGGVLLLLSWVF